MVPAWTRALRDTSGRRRFRPSPFSAERAQFGPGLKVLGTALDFRETSPHIQRCKRSKPFPHVPLCAWRLRDLRPSHKPGPSLSEQPKAPCRASPNPMPVWGSNIYSDRPGTAPCSADSRSDNPCRRFEGKTSRTRDLPSSRKLDPAQRRPRPYVCWSSEFSVVPSESLLRSYTLGFRMLYIGFSHVI